jgi:hypothetical protein
MIYSIRAMVLYKGNVMRSGIARIETVIRHLMQQLNLTGYEVRYWLHGQPYRATGEAFLSQFSPGPVECE